MALQGNENEEPLRELVRQLHGLQPDGVITRARMTACRRLYLEAYTMGIAELRRTVDAPRETAPRVVQLREREERQTQQAARLSGLDCQALQLEGLLRNPSTAVHKGSLITKAFTMQGMAEPSHALCDKASANFTRDTLSRIEWKARP